MEVPERVVRIKCPMKAGQPTSPLSERFPVLVQGLSLTGVGRCLWPLSVLRCGESLLEESSRTVPLAPGPRGLPHRKLTGKASQQCYVLTATAGSSRLPAGRFLGRFPWGCAVRVISYLSSALFSLATCSFDGQGYAAVLSLTPTRVDWPPGKTRHHVEGARTKHQLRVRAKNERSTSGPFLVGSRCVLLPGFLFAVLPGDRFGWGLVP